MNRARIWSSFGLSLAIVGTVWSPVRAGPRVPTILRVVQGAQDGDGSSWATPLGNLHEAIAATASLEGPVQLWIAQGTYAPGGAGGSALALGGNLQMLGGFVGSESTAGERSDDPDLTVITADREGNDDGSSGARLDNLSGVLTAAHPDGPILIDTITVTGATGGSAFTATNAVVELRNCQFIDNHGGSAVGISGFGQLTVTDGFFLNNQAPQGAAVAGQETAGQLRLSTFDCSFIGNESAGGEGGALWFEGTDLRMERCSFQDNTAQFGGAVHARDTPTVRIIDCEFRSNVARESAGAVWLEQSVAGGLAPVEITRCGFWNNQAQSGTGAALKSTQWNTYIERCEFLGNRAFGRHPINGAWVGEATLHLDGASGHRVTDSLFTRNFAAGVPGLLMEDGQATVLQCTFANNHAAYVSVVGGGAVARDSTIRVWNSIFWGNRFGVGNDDSQPGQGGELAQLIVDDAILDLQDSIVEGLTGFLGGNGNLGLDPRFVDATSDNYQLQPNSPAVDAARNDRLLPNQFLDLGGNPRVRDGNGDEEATVDMGAFELQLNSTPISDPPIEPPAPSPTPGLSLRAPYPNPSNGIVFMEFQLPSQTEVEVMIFDLRGRRVKTLHAGSSPAGSGRLEWNGADESGHPVAAAPYLVRMTTTNPHRIAWRRIVRTHP